MSNWKTKATGAAASVIGWVVAAPFIVAAVAGMVGLCVRVVRWAFYLE